MPKRHRNLLLLANGLLGALLVATLATARADAQGAITGPSSIRGKCCKTAMEGNRFCCLNCCLGRSYCISDYDPACAAPAAPEDEV